jgi:2,3,4,5-tetrahydropyridine-2-carboxylate N-succinyltransferase
MTDMDTTDLFETIDGLYEADAPDEQTVRDCLETLLEGLEDGSIRSARPTDDGWEAVASVKRGILLGFRVGGLRAFKAAGPLTYSDKDTFPPQNLPVHQRNIRVVPGGSAVRRGAYLGQNVTVMPPAYVNVGAYVGDDTMVDSHALVGSCAQIGEGVHLSAGAQIGGVLEPVGQQPVIVEDGALIGGNTGVYEGVQVGEGAVLAAGCVVTGSTPIYDLVHETVRTSDDGPLEIPSRAVVVPGTRPASGDWAEEKGLQMNALMIAKYRDAQTDTQTALEEALR